ncbi:MAG: tol-pal system protein YbgF [Rhodobacteraceae bacterium]|jgi:tol-pal system protein YbgF|nr:tol-pal system protein YbgF [Paracoccaceae bacterium]
MLRLALALGLLLAGPAAAQSREETLADIRQQLTVLWVEVQNLKRELSTTGAPQTGLEGSTLLDRVNSAESALSQLTAKTEELQNRVDTLVRDGTNRIGDLEFRLCELEEGCDISALGDTPTLGGGALPGGGAAPATGGGTAPAQGGSQAVGEQADFDRAKAAFDSGDFAGAAGLFQTFTQTYTAGPLNGEAHYWRGEALARQGNTEGAARAFLDSFSGAPSGSVAPQALFRLGQSLGELGQVQEACVTLAEVGSRFPGAPAAAEAQGARQLLGCQ